MNYKSFFWLHIKKSAGITTRKLLQPYYVEVEKRKKPKTFIQSKPEEYNDILNNFRVVLGEYQFKRALFAKTFLYDNWNSIYSFAFSREPIDRCISMFYYLYHHEKSIISHLLTIWKNIKNRKKIGISISYDFDIFLELIEMAHYNSNSNYKPKGLAFSTHTAPMFNDITDDKGKILLTKIYRLEDLNNAIEEVFKLCRLNYQHIEKSVIINKNKYRGNFQPNLLQRKKIEELYRKDFEIYENTTNIFKN